MHNDDTLDACRFFLGVIAACLWAWFGITLVWQLWDLAHPGFFTGRFDQFDVVVIGTMLARATVSALVYGLPK